MSITSLQRWLFTQALLWTVVLAFGAWTVASPDLRVLVLSVVAVLMLVSYATLWKVLRVEGTPADWVTLGRFLGMLAAMLIAGTAVASDGRISWLVWSLIVVVVCVDLLDGYVARRWGATDAGAMLDQETDQLTLLGLTLIATGCARMGVWITLLPFMKYGYILLLAVVGQTTEDPKPQDGDNSRGRFICALVMVALLICLLPVAAPWLQSTAGIIAVLALGYSFGSDAIFLLQRKKVSTAA